jgi:hypothetical protein
MAKLIAIVQSNYVPWKGYFDLINMVDEFVILDSVQYTRRDWRNRNRIKTAQGTAWLTIPVVVKGRFLQTIRETTISDPRLNLQHWKTLVQWYSKAACFGLYKENLEELFVDAKDQYLSQLNFRFLLWVCRTLGINTPLTWADSDSSETGNTERLVRLCQRAGATDYLSGPSARAYMDHRLFDDAGIRVHYMAYDGYPEYPQLHGPFEHGVSILDLILNMGPDASKYMLSFA